MKEYCLYKSHGIPPDKMTDLIVAESLHDEVDP